MRDDDEHPSLTLQVEGFFQEPSASTQSSQGSKRLEG